MRTMTSLTLTLVFLMLPFTAFAGHSETHDTGWFEYQYNEDDTVVLYCNALGEISIGGLLYIHDRDGWLDDDPLHSGGSTWIVTESNGIPGLQIGGQPALPDVPDPTGQHPYLVTFQDPYGPANPDEDHPGCPNGDNGVF